MAEMPDSIDVQCPACGHLTKVTPEWVGRQARCQCGFTFVVSASVPTRVLKDVFNPGRKDVTNGVVADVVEDVVEDVVAVTRAEAGASAKTNDAPSAPPSTQSTFRPAPAVDCESGIPDDIRELLGPREMVLYTEVPSVGFVFLRVAAVLVAVGLPLLLFTAGALAGNSPGGVCTGLTGLGVLGIVLLVNSRGWKARSLVITDRRTLVRYGSFVTRIHLVPHDSIVSLSVETRLGDRLVKTRSIRIHTAGRGVLLPNSSGADRVVALLAEVRAGHDDLL